MNSVAAANAPEVWDRIWTEEGPASWRGERMANVYARIAELMTGDGVDLGGGVGCFADVARDHGKTVMVYDQSEAACRMARQRGHKATCGRVQWYANDGENAIGTEILEHLEEDDRQKLLIDCQESVCFWSVPNNRLGPDEEPQHTIKWTAVEFLRYLRRFYAHVRVECIDEYLLAVCGVDKGFRLSVCTPARDEQDDIERTLSSFRGVADELVVGIDPRSIDETENIARQYADVVFTLDDPTQGKVCEKGVHFAAIRNQCMNRCTGDWIFMTEAHESLDKGVDELLTFANSVPAHVGAIFVTRSGQGQQWLFPWLSRNRSDIRYYRATHNYLEWPHSVDSRAISAITTLHLRSARNAKARTAQRKAQNRKFLHEDWREQDNANSLFYLGQEWRTYDTDRAIRYFEKFLATEKSRGGIRYQARLILSKLYASKDRFDDARQVLLPATGDDWQRTEHWLWLGDIALHRKQYEEALHLYRLAASKWPELPLSLFWFDVASYTYLLAQKMATAAAACGRLKESLLWADRVIESLPEETPAEMRTEAVANRDRIEEAINAKQS